MKKFLGGLFIIVILAAVVFYFGPRPPADDTVHFDAAVIGDDLEAYLASSETKVGNLTEGAEKEIVWADPNTRQKTPVAVIYLHGFSATKWETRPLSDDIAKQLGANLYYNRLTGHGSDGDSLAKATMNDWINDAAEAIAIGERIGDNLLVVSTSTGGSLSTWIAAQPNLSKNITGFAMVSPNFAVHGASTDMMNMPWAETLLPMIVGHTRSFEPANEEHGKWWTTSYPTKSIFPLAALLKTVNAIDHSKIKTPSMFIYSHSDSVVVPERTAEIAALWGGSKEIMLIEKSGDPNNHVIAGDIRSPDTTKRIGDAIVTWFRTLN